MGSLVRIVVADDHAVVRSGLRLLLDSEPGFEVVGDVGEVAKVAEIVTGAAPDVLLLDVHMRGGSSLGLIPDLVSRTTVLVLTMQDDPGYARRAMRAGARGYVLKEAEDSELVQAVRTVAAGGTYLDPALGGRILAEGVAPQPETLTARERDILRLLALGHTSAEMADRLFLSVRTVETHRANIHRKLGTDNRAELVRHALDEGLVTP